MIKLGKGQMLAVYGVLMEPLKKPQGTPRLLRAHFKKHCSRVTQKRCPGHGYTDSGCHAFYIV